MQPAEGIRFIHAAICREVVELEDQAAVAESPEQLAALDQRLASFAQIVILHGEGEEASIYPAIETKLRAVGAAYLHDHQDEKALFADLRAKIAAARAASGATRAGALAKVRRQAIALTEHLTPHVHKEDALITPLLCELFTPPEQGAQIGQMMGVFPPDVMARTLPWLVGHLTPDDRVSYMMMLERALPPERFAGACGWIRGGVAADVWAGVTARVPGLS